jgi:hypothetical protein
MLLGISTSMLSPYHGDGANGRYPTYLSIVRADVKGAERPGRVLRLRGRKMAKAAMTPEPEENACIKILPTMSWNVESSISGLLNHLPHRATAWVAASSEKSTTKR